MEDRPSTFSLLYLHHQSARAESSLGSFSFTHLGLTRYPKYNTPLVTLTTCSGGQGILNPMQAFLNTLAFHGWTGLDLDLRLQRRQEQAWDSASTSIATTGVYNPMLPSTLLYQSHVQDGKKLTGNGHHLPSDAVSILSESNSTLTLCYIELRSKTFALDPTSGPQV